MMSPHTVLTEPDFNAQCGLLRLSHTLYFNVCVRIKLSVITFDMFNSVCALRRIVFYTYCTVTYT